MKLDKSLFHAFVCIFGLDGAQNTPFFPEDNQSNLSIKLCADYLRTPCETKTKDSCTVTVN